MAKFVSMQFVPFPCPKVAFDAGYGDIVKLVGYVVKMDEDGEIHTFGLEDNGFCTVGKVQECELEIIDRQISQGSLLYNQMLKAALGIGTVNDEDEFLDYCAEMGVKIKIKIE